MSILTALLAGDLIGTTLVPSRLWRSLTRLRDPQGIEWDLELDAVGGQVLKDHQGR